tara:strand:+ start:173 stop:478 length:306 start_codon:yes stop_codon:yes gene_type:complete
MVKFKIVDTPQEKKEKDIQRDIVQYLRSIGCSVDVITQGMYGTSGISDIVGVKDGRALYIEVKRQGQRPTELQMNFLEEKENHGAMAFWTDSVEKVKKMKI